ncbi:hypothetical protein [Rhizobium phaseoli]|uniref:hypothetical protein n=1 Tax=Rhizobium phaseoli TaxID=396 RepID=UPI0025578CAD|nr:hypothetical protein [Rhizobium phaseoli]MDK4724928.1 hypothetical protein [Rhizobium phaseoli]
MAKITTITRDDLYAAVWSHSGKDVARQLDISDVYLGFVCRALEVPRPGPGYWRRRRLGLDDAVPSLPMAGPDTPRTWTKNDPVEFARRRTPPRPPRPAVTEAPVHKARSARHELVSRAETEFRTAKTGDGFYLRPQRWLLADVCTSAGGLDKALLFASALFNRLEEAGHSVAVATGSEILIRVEIDKDEGSPGPGYQADSPLPWAPRRPTVANVRGVPLGLSVVEVSETRHLVYVGDATFIPWARFRKDEHVGYAFETYRRRPSGRLKLTAYSPFHDVPWRQEWIEKPGEALDTRLEEVVAVLEAAAIDLALRLEKAGRFFT